MSDEASITTIPTWQIQKEEKFYMEAAIISKFYEFILRIHYKKYNSSKNFKNNHVFWNFNNYVNLTNSIN